MENALKMAPIVPVYEEDGCSHWDIKRIMVF
jgi:hypothetical protein